MKKKEKEQLRHKLWSKLVIFDKNLNILPILHTFSDLVEPVRICLTPPPPLSEKNQNFANPCSGLVLMPYLVNTTA